MLWQLIRSRQSRCLATILLLLGEPSRHLLIFVFLHSILIFATILHYHDDNLKLRYILNDEEFASLMIKRSSLKYYI